MNKFTSHFLGIFKGIFSFVFPPVEKARLFNSEIVEDVLLRRSIRLAHFLIKSKRFYSVCGSDLSFTRLYFKSKPHDEKRNPENNGFSFCNYSWINWFCSNLSLESLERR